MSADPRAALSQLFTAFERHLEASSSRHGDDDPTVIATYEDLADAFETYDGALFDAYGEMTPLDIYSGEDEGSESDGVEDHDDEDGDDARLYSGFDEGVDFDDSDDDDPDDDDADDLDDDDSDEPDEDERS